MTGRERTDAASAPQASADDLELITRAVRDKLDRVGIKVHLREWQAISRADRQLLCDLPCSTAAEVTHYAATVESLVRSVTGRAPDRL